MRYLVVLVGFICLFFSHLSFAVLADDFDSVDDSWESVNTIDDSLLKQKPITDEDFNKTVQQMRDQRKSKKFKFFWLKDDGKPLTQPAFLPQNAPPDVDTDSLMSVQDIVKETPTIMVPTDVITEDGVMVPTGFYKLSMQKEQDNFYKLLLMQGNNLVAKVNAYQTNEEFAPDELNFAKAIFLNDKVKLIYGSLDLNLEAYLQVTNKH